METVNKSPASVTVTKHKPKGGARPGAGRKPNTKNVITVNSLLKELADKTDKDYEALLVEDFLKAREGKDNNLTMKYHQLILSRVMNNLNRVEIVDNGESLEQKEKAFSEALKRLVSKVEE